MIAVFERQLAGAGITVTESKMVQDRDGVNREIDIALEGEFGSHSVLAER
ncbi:MAG: hypothetical protein ACYDAG_03185 [Chloroflexota bacterium]